MTKQDALDLVPVKYKKYKELYGGGVSVRAIQAWQAKNFDGTPGGWEKGTEDGDRWCVEVRTVNHMSGKIDYKNYW